MTNSKSLEKSRGRAGLLDEVRGFAIICMVVYHAMYDLNTIFGLDIPIFFESWFDVIRDIFAGAFIFISGTVCRYSRNNMRRGIQCFFLGMIITFVLPFFIDGTVYFGILHFMGISMMLFGLGEKILDVLPAAAGILLCAALFTLTWNLPNGHIDAATGQPIGFFGISGVFELRLPAQAYNDAMFPLGLPSPKFSSADYFPLMPWFFLFLAGSYFGIWAKSGSLPKFFYATRIKWLAAVGRYTIWIYVLHQPILYLIFNIIF